MKKLLYLILFTSLLYLAYQYRDNIYEIYYDIFVSIEEKVTKLEPNDYYRDYSFSYAKNTTKFIPENKKDIINIYYTIVNSGMTDFTFYCPKEYTNCISDVNDVANDQNTISNLNNFVHPFNSFTNLKTIVASTGEITIEINYLYNAEQIAKIENKVDQIIKDQINTYDSPSTKIKAIHDYIVSNTQYDVERNTTGDSNYLSYLAYGPLFDGYATCSGYTDLMAIFLDKFGIKNYKVATTADRISNSNNGHIWNAVYLDGEWLHLDLTWDDPVSDGDVNYITHSYFLISTEKLIILDEGLVKVEDHNFDRSVYTELK